MADQGDETGSSVEPHMRIYDNRVVVVDAAGNKVEYREGTQTQAARDRYERIQSELERGYLQDLIDRVTDVDADVVIEIEDRYRDLIDEIVDAITSERGRAIAGLLCGQLTIKSLAPEQSVRLHKGSRSSAHFGWEEGLSMRTIDSTYIAPALREADLLRVNKDGVMMTRSLAENYPYSRFYKANIRGAQEEWAELIDAVERPNGPNPEELLKYLIRSLHNRGERAAEVIEETMEQVERVVDANHSEERVYQTITAHIQNASHGARLFEIALHSLYQVLEDYELIDGVLKDLGQMRSANKKHGNIGDIEVVDPDDEFQIYTAWDAKYGKEHLRHELEELDDKLRQHPEVEEAGFVTFSPPKITDEIDRRAEELERQHDVTIRLISFDDLVSEKTSLLHEQRLATPSEWLQAYAETLCQKRRDRAPIDEPTQEWVKQLGTVLSQGKLGQ